MAATKTAPAGHGRPGEAVPGDEPAAATPDLARGSDRHLPPGAPGGIEDPFDPANTPADMPADPTTVGPPEEGLSESLTEELAALIDDGRTYVGAEINFQKTRASLAGKHAGIALGLAVVAVVVLHVAVLAFAVGLVMALAPLVTIWGSIAIVVGTLLGVTGLLGWQAARHGQRIGEIFSAGDASSPPARVPGTAPEEEI
ncbi:phage holin family protein [Erythrobacter sp. HL-111]|uniref:phage holin family protein n=1 Tax=Erythrobacter sp. HL-111 TaxID=1798193 RepID=UPI0006DA6350|nr:phage holin family protein [Erythrobacter sp. HL-111]KPP93228.1 MAG: Protein of unknown function (DUF1469) [Erythrobacteraceae bacterium HL-111]